MRAGPGGSPDLGVAVDRVKAVFHGAKLVDVQPVQPAPVFPDAALWLTGDHGDLLPQNVVRLAQKHGGWTPATWRDRLLQMADRCETTNPKRSSDLRLGAVALMSHRLEEYQERAAIMEYDGGLPRAQAEANALRDFFLTEHGKRA